MMNLFEAACTQAVAYDIGSVMEKAGIASSMSSDIYFAIANILSNTSRLDYNLESPGTSSDDLSVVSLERQWKRERNPVAKLNLAREIFHRKGGRR